MSDPDLFGWSMGRASSAEIAKQKGMERVDVHADEIWKERMYECVLAVARNWCQFTSDDVFAVAERRGWAAGTHDLRAFGPVMMRAAKAGVCRKADCAPVPSRRASLHASPRAVWDSLICQVRADARA